ncbi:uncharacterized protein DEA37_0015203 [Paragonimus westermani]|uniref:Uncharacterized protein n=1 Tax=Paragonimus westermani TaxID=34504 RepID=A0A5J4P2Y5_9TREM|nr:uncharacterized protein DEA37_0015203 [Paragonimus westermani]
MTLMPLQLTDVSPGQVHPLADTFLSGIYQFEAGEQMKPKIETLEAAVPTKSSAVKLFNRPDVLTPNHEYKGKECEVGLNPPGGTQERTKPKVAAFLYSPETVLNFSTLLQLTTSSYDPITGNRKIQPGSLRTTEICVAYIHDLLLGFTISSTPVEQVASVAQLGTFSEISEHHPIWLGEREFESTMSTILVDYADSGHQVQSELVLNSIYHLPSRHSKAVKFRILTTAEATEIWLLNPQF